MTNAAANIKTWQGWMWTPFAAECSGATNALFQGTDMFKILATCPACLFLCRTFFFLLGLIQIRTSGNNFTAAWFTKDWQ